jgi:hypothetical protein
MSETEETEVVQLKYMDDMSEIECLEEGLRLLRAAVAKQGKTRESRLDDLAAEKNNWEFILKNYAITVVATEAMHAAVRPSTCTIEEAVEKGIAIAWHAPCPEGYSKERTDAYNEFAAKANRYIEEHGHYPHRATKNENLDETDIKKENK